MRVSSSLLLVIRLCSGILFGLIGWSIAATVPDSSLPAIFASTILLELMLALAMGIPAAILFPGLLARPINHFIDQISHMSGIQVMADFIGIFIGLLVAALVALPLSLLPDPFRQVLPLLGAMVFAYLGVVITNVHYREFMSLLNIRIPDRKEEAVESAGGRMYDRLLLDTSVIIDGRIADICATGFIRGGLVVPRFILNELQYVADASDGMRRARGRRGLEVLRRLQKDDSVNVQIVDDDPGPSYGVDEKLVLLAKQWQCPIITNDYNLNKVASLQGVGVLNINELANAVKSILLPGETVSVRVIQEGKEAGQGVGYLADGTMIVIEDGSSLINQMASVTVTKVLQTAAGRMIFAKP